MIGNFVFPVGIFCESRFPRRGCKQTAIVNTFRKTESVVYKHGALEAFGEISNDIIPVFFFYLILKTHGRAGGDGNLEMG